MTGAVPPDSAVSVGDLVTRARERTGLADLGPDSWREGLAIIVDTLEHAPAVGEAGRDSVYGQCVDALGNRLRLTEYIGRHPEVGQERIERPLVIMGLPRTGTTVASYLLDQDPDRRSLLNWEAGDSVPPATSQTLYTDPRCLAKKAELDAFAAELEAARIAVPHWEEADGPTECTFVHNQDFKAFFWEAFMPTPAYSDWLLSTDMTSAYEYEKSLLQVLQSRAPGAWSLKMPSHAVHVEALLAVFPDARLVWAHRDPFKVTGSALSMYALAKSMVVPAPDSGSYVPQVLDQLRAHVERPLAARRRIGDDRFFDLHYARLLRDPAGEMRALYEWAGDTLTPRAETAMLGWLERNPQHRFGARPYSLAAYGLSAADLEPLFATYLDAFDIELEGAA